MGHTGPNEWSWENYRLYYRTKDYDPSDLLLDMYCSTSSPIVCTDDLISSSDKSVFTVSRILRMKEVLLIYIGGLTLFSW